jgi:hypothetical protein
MKALIGNLAALAMFALSVPALAQNAPPAHHIRGTLTAVADDRLTVSTPAGPVSVPIDAKTKVVGVVAAGPDEITSGTFIGTANVPGPSSTSTRALEVVVFPASMAGTGEGDYPWDLPAGRHSSMTNGTVAARHGSMMTNGTVMGVNNRSSKIITLQYKGGSKMVTIPPGVPIVRVEAAPKSLLAAGAHVFVVAGKAGAAAPFVVVGEGGIVPPM